jgi:hypothetical protein
MGQQESVQELSGAEVLKGRGHPQAPGSFQAHPRGDGLHRACWDLFECHRYLLSHVRRVVPKINVLMFHTNFFLTFLLILYIYAIML